MTGESDSVLLERERVLREYRRREREIPADRYAPWRPEEIFMRAGRRRLAAAMLSETGVFPGRDDACLEVGFGSLGWLGELLCWGVPQRQLHGIELDPARARLAQELLPEADLRVGDAAELPWENNAFRLVIASTLFTSILDPRLRERIAREITRVLAPGRALLWYDFAVNNPRNPNVRRVGRRELSRLFPELEGRVRSVTLAPPLARFVASRSWVAATILEEIPFLRTHLLAVLRKKTA